MTLTRQIQPEEFAVEESHLHGRGHIHRVMFWADKICTVHGLQAIRGEILAAARIHDIARLGDGVCHIHGAAAAVTVLPRYEKFLRETFGMENPDAVSYACSVHCLPTPLDREHPHYMVAAVLRDADALDRFRLGPHEGPDPNRIHLQRSLYFAKAAFQLAHSTNNETPLEEIERLGNQLSNPAANARLTCPDPPEREETPRQRRNRRLKQGKFANDLAATVNLLEEKRILQEAAKMVAQGLPIPLRRGLVEGLKAAVEFSQAFRVITYFPEEGYQAFLKEGKTRCVWETGPTWHTRFASSKEDAMDAKAYNDFRLWGEKGVPITYGSLIPAGEGGEYIHGQLKQMYGERFVEWDFEKIAEHSSFCINDSQETPFCLPCDVFHETIVRQLVAGLSRHQEWAAILMQACPYPEILQTNRFHFVEIQIHRAMTPADQKRP